MFKNEIIDRFMHCTMHSLKKSAQVSTSSLTDLNIGQFVELTFFEHKLGVDWPGNYFDLWDIWFNIRIRNADFQVIKINDREVRMKI